MRNSAYKIIKLENKDTVEEAEEKANKDTSEVSIDEEFKSINVTELHEMFKSEMTRINTEIDDITTSIRDFQQSTDKQLEAIISSLESIENNVGGTKQ